MKVKLFTVKVPRNRTLLSIRNSAAFVIVFALFVQVPALGFLINKDVAQTFEDPQDNYEIVLEGDWRNVNTDPNHVINPFQNGTTQLSYDSATNTTTVSFSGDEIPQSSDRERHFGFGFGIAQNHGKIKSEYWTRGDTKSSTPGASTSYFYNPDLRELMVTISNDTADAIRINSTFFDHLLEPAPLATMNRVDMPRGSGQATGIEDNTELDTGQSAEFTIEDVGPDDAIVVFVAVSFASPPPGGYDAEVGIWMQVTGADYNPGKPPTVSQWGLIIMAVLLVSAGTIAIVRRKRQIAG